MWLPPSCRYVLILGSMFVQRERALVGLRRHLPVHPLVDATSSPYEPRTRYLDHVLPADPTDPAAVLEAVRDLERRTGSRPSAAVPISELTFDAAYRVAESYDLIRLPEPALVRDKLAMKTALASHGLPIADFQVVEDEAGLTRAARRFGYPLVLKANALSGSEGIIYVGGPADLGDAYRKAQEALGKQERAYPQYPARLFAEPYAELPEYSVEVLNAGPHKVVLTATDKTITRLPNFAELGQVVPGVRGADPRIHQAAIEACRALRIVAGVAHVEFRGDLIGEVAGRTAGDAILDQLERSTRLNAYGWHAATYLSHSGPLLETPPARGTSAIAFLKAPTGTIREIHIPEVLPGEVVRLEVSARVGDRSRLPSDNDAREGLIEMWWPGRLGTDRPLTEHVELAEKLSAEIFVVAPGD